MKKILFPVILIVLAVLAFGVWQYTAMAPDPSIDEQTVEINSTNTFSDQTYRKQSELITVDITYPQTGYDALDAQLKKDLDAEVSQLEAQAQDGAEFIKDFGIPYSLMGQYVVTRNDQRYLSFQLPLYLYTGGAHGNATSWTFIYDKVENELLTQEDLFEKNSGYVNELSALSIQQLSEGEMIDSIDWLREGAGPDPMNFDKLLLTDTELLIIFDPYVVGPYAAGVQQVSIPLTQIQQYFSPEHQIYE